MPHIGSHASSSLHKALIAHHACIHPDGTPETAPTCEARPSRSPGLASGAARPCKQSQCLTLCHMPPLLCATPPVRPVSELIAPAGSTTQWNAQKLTPPVRPVCPEAPVWPVEPLAPASTHNASRCVTCLPFSVQASELIMPAYNSMESSMERQTLNPPVRPVCPEAPVWPVEPLAPASTHNASHCVTCLPFSAQSSES